MQVSQIYELTNTVTKEVLGESAVVNEDLSNLVDIGNEVANANQVDNYVKKLVDHIGKVVFVNRPYAGSAPSVLMDGWEYGSVLEKISGDIPDAKENEAWQLENGTSYDPNIFYQPTVEAKFFNSKTTFEVDKSVASMQVKEAFSSAEQMNGLMSMIENDVYKSLTIKTDALILRTIDNFIAATIQAEYSGGDLTASSGVRAVNLLYLYKNAYPDASALTPAQAVRNPEFIRFAVMTMGLYADRLKQASRLFNIGKKARFTPEDTLHTVLLSEFARAAGVYLYDANGQVNTGNIQLPKHEIVTYWQGSGTDYSFDSTSSINVKDAGNDTVTASGILGVMFDRDALGVCNQNRRTLTDVNNVGEFITYRHKIDASYFNDQNENFVVFFAA